MNSKMDEFRAFVNKYPKIRDEVRGGKRTWQNIYEEWVLYGENNPQWQTYADEGATADPTQSKPNEKANASNAVNLDSIKSIYGYIKKIDPNSINRTLNTVQKVLQIVQSVNGGSKVPNIPVSGGLYNDWWD